MTIESLSPSIATHFDGKVAVITGGSRGIGKAIADRLIKEGVRVVIGDILEEEGNAAVEEYNGKSSFKVAAFLRTDVTKYSDNKALFQLAESEFGGVDIAILNAGIASNSNTIFSPLDDDLEDKMFNVNALGVIKGSKVALLHMAKRGGGSIVCTASMAGLYCLPFLNAYNATKHAVVAFVRSCGYLPAVCNVRINAVCPGFVETDFLSNIESVDGLLDPCSDILKFSPRVPVEYVVEGNLMFLSDKTRNAEVLMVLPDGPKFSIAPVLPECMKTEASLRAEDFYNENAVPHAKKQLANALKHYRIDK